MGDAVGEAEGREDTLFDHGEVKRRTVVDGGYGLALRSDSSVRAAAEVELDKRVAGAGRYLHCLLLRHAGEDSWQVGAEEWRRVEGFDDIVCHGR